MVNAFPENVPPPLGPCLLPGEPCLQKGCARTTTHRVSARNRALWGACSPARPTVLVACRVLGKADPVEQLVSSRVPELSVSEGFQTPRFLGWPDPLPRSMEQ